ncbi:MAG: hypothetical protein ACM3NO_06985 [Deltaproteobacteria bacterium]
MSAGKAIFLGFKVIILAIGLTISFIVGSLISGLGRAPAASGAAAAAAPAATSEPANILLLLFVSSLIQAIIVSYLVLEAQWGGWKVTVALFLVFLNMFLQATVESVVYLSGKVPFQFNYQMPITGLVIAVLFAPFAVLVMGGFGKARATPKIEYARWTPGEWAGRVAALAVVVLAVYYLCGYYIAWQNPELRQFYQGSTDIKSFWVHMAAVWSGTPWMIPYQAARGLFWVVMTLPALWMLRGGRARVALGGALMYAALGGTAMLILPNPLMPPAVAHTHLIETTISGLMLGAFVGWTMYRREAVPPADEVQSPKAA